MALKISDFAAPEPLYYRLEPVYPSKPGGIATAAIVTCLATGKTLHHCGGGGNALGVDVVRALDARQHGGRARVIVDAQDWDDLRACLGKLTVQLEERGYEGISEEILFTLEAAEQLVERTAS